MTQDHPAPPPAEPEPPDQTCMIPELRDSGKKRAPQSETPKKSSGSQTPALFLEEELAGDQSPIDMEGSSGLRIPLAPCGERYHMKRLLATGGFGKIFLAEDRLLDREMVIKSLRTDFLQNRTVKEHFISEAKLCARLNHPAIVPIYELNTDSLDGLHIAMQRVNGIDLQLYLERFREQLRNHALSAHRYMNALHERLALFIRICDAIAYCHERNVIHNDLKPGNIMIGSFNQIYVMDWGTASADNAVCHGDIQGTCAYMAPERIANRTSTRRTDIFSLGMILNEIVTLQGPIREDSVGKVLERICTGNFEPSTSAFPQYRVPEALRAIIEKARCPRPAERYESVPQLAADIRHYLFHEEVSACPDSLLKRGLRFGFRHQRLAAAAGLLLVLAAAGLQFGSYVRRNRMEAELKNRMFENLRCQTETDQLAGHLNQELALLQGELRSIGSVFLHEMENRKASGPGAAIPEVKDFAPGSKHRPEGLIHTAYYRYPITLDNGVVYRFASPDRRADGVFRAMHSQLLNTMFINSTSGKSNLRNDRKKIFHLQECLIRRMIFLVDGQSAYCFPGMFGPEKSAEDFQTDFARRAFRGQSHLFWTPVYTDSSGIPVLGCWLPVLNRRGILAAKIGFEIHYAKFMAPVLEQAEREHHQSVYAIVDREDRVIYSTVKHLAGWSENRGRPGRDAANSELFYRFPQLMRKIRTPGTPAHFSTVLNRWKCRIFWTPLPAAGWILIRHIPDAPAAQVSSRP